MEGDLGNDHVDQKTEIEDLKLKLQTATQIFVQQERHFSSLVKELENKLSEAIAGRDELLKLRQQESVTQQQLIYQLQTALQQTNQSLELRCKELSDCDSRAKMNEEKIAQAETALVKIHNILKDEEIKRGSTNVLTGLSVDYDHLYTGDLLIQVLSNFLNDDDAKISDLFLKKDEVERKLLELRDNNESYKVKLIREYESKLINLEADHAKSLDIAANRTLTERNRITELLCGIDENKLRYEKTISDHERMIASLEENIRASRAELDKKNEEHALKHGKEIALREEMQRQLENLERDKEEILNNMLKKTTCETSYEEKISSLENQVNECRLKLQDTETNSKNTERQLLRNISQLKEVLKEKEDEINRLNKEHKEEIKRKSDIILSLERGEGSELFTKLQNNNNESIRQISTLTLELSQKTDEIFKFIEECRTLRARIDKMAEEKSSLLSEKEELVLECENLNKRVLILLEEKTNLSNLVRENVDDLIRAKNVINNLQVKLDEKEKSSEVFNEQEAELSRLLFQKHLVGESLLQERQKIVEFLEEKVKENDELKNVRDTLAQKLESKIQVLTEMEATCRALEKKLEVRSNELEVIMEDRNKAVKEVENKVVELTKLKEERDSLVTLMNGKQSEKDREIAKLLSRLKSMQHDLALTKKVLEAKKEANEKAIRIASVTQEEITAKRKEMDGLKDRIKWLQDSLQATAEEKVHFESKASELETKLRGKNQENENMRTELDQVMKYYDSANGQVNQMEMALEKAGIKFAESQALVERLEQDLAKIKLQYSLEVKELEMKVKSVEGRGQHVQVVKPFRLQDDETKVPCRYRESVMASTKELNATHQRLVDEAEMTEGFKTLLKDLHELMSNIRDSGVVQSRENNMVEKNTPTVQEVVTEKTEERKTVATTKESNKESSKNRDGKIIEDYEAITTFPVDCNSSRESSSKPSRDGGNEFKKKIRTSKSVEVSAPLHSSSPKSTSPVFDNDVGNESMLENTFLFSDINDVESGHIESRHDRTTKLTSESLKSSIARKPKSVQKLSRQKEKIDSYVEPEDVDSLLMPLELPPRSHRRAKKILDILTLKGQELTSANKKLAELIGRQDDGIKRCREAEESIKKTLK